MTTTTRAPELLDKIDAYWRAANYLSVGQIYLYLVGDGEAETGPLATAWQSNKFLNPISDGAVLPILHLNGYKTSSPTVLGRIEHEELEQFLRGCGWTPHFVEGDVPEDMHRLMAGTLEETIEDIRQIQSNARSNNDTTRPRWPMLVLISPKGWTGPKVIDGVQIEGTFRAHQVPLSDPAAHPDHLKRLEDWLKSYRPEQLFDEDGRLQPDLAELAPKGNRRMSANPHANAGILLRDLRMPDFREYAQPVPNPGVRGIGDVHVLGPFLRDVTNKIHVRGYKEEGTITTPFDMTVLDDLDRFHLVIDVIDRVPRTGETGLYLKQQLKDKLVEHKQYIEKHGEDLPEIRNWEWNTNGASAKKLTANDN